MTGMQVIVLIRTGFLRWEWVADDGNHGRAFTERGALRQIEKVYGRDR